ADRSRPLRPFARGLRSDFTRRGRGGAGGRRGFSLVKRSAVRPTALALGLLPAPRTITVARTLLSSPLFVDGDIHRLAGDGLAHPFLDRGHGLFVAASH